MGIIVKPTAEKKIVAIGIDGNEIELQSVYLRLEFSARAEGKGLEIASSSFFSKEAFRKGINLACNMNLNSGLIELKEGEKQDLTTANKYISEALKAQGYETEIEA